MDLYVGMDVGGTRSRAVVDAAGTLRGTALPDVTGALLGAPLPPGAGRSGVEQVVGTVHRDPPIGLARLAPLVSAAAEAGDPVACRIVAAAADALVAAVAAIRDAGERTPIVLAGSVAGGDTPVAARTRGVLEQRWPGCVVVAGDGARAAAWLAAVRSGLPAGAAARLHATLLLLPASTRAREVPRRRRVRPGSEK